MDVKRLAEKDITEHLGEETTLVVTNKRETENGEEQDAIFRVQYETFLNAIKDNLKDLFDEKVDIADIVDNLTSPGTTKALSANQGKVLDEKIKVIKSQIGDIETLLGGI